MRNVVRKIAVLVVALVGIVGRADAQFTIQRRQPEQREEVKSDPYKAFGGFVDNKIQNDYYDHAAWLAERRRIRKQRNTFEIQTTFQTSALQFENWTAGGNNTFSGLATIFMRHQYKRNKFASDLTINGRYGINYIDNAPFKNVDEIKIKELLSWDIQRSGWSYSVTINFRTQFADGFVSRTDNTLKSAFMSPGYFDVSGGFTYAPKNAPYKVSLSPIAGNMVSMLDERLYEQGLNGVPAGDKIYSMIGPSVNISFDKHFFNKVLRYRSTLYGFYGLNDLATPPTVRWDNTVDVNLSKYMSIQLYGVFYYLKTASPKPQYQYSATVGLSYKFKNK